MKKIFYSSIILLTLFSSCEKIVEVDIPQKQPKLVINALLGGDTNVVVTIGTSRHILSSTNQQTSLRESYTVKNAVPVLYENNMAVDTLVYHPNEYLYKSLRTRRLQPGQAYTLKVNAQGYTQAEATTTMPAAISGVEVSRTKRVRKNVDGDDLDEISIKISDPSNKDFYLIQVFSAGYNAGYQSNIYCISTSDKDVELLGNNTDPFDPDNCYDPKNILLNDINFNGTQKHLKLFALTDELRDIRNTSTGQIVRPSVRVSRITEDYFRYLKSYGLYESSVDNPFAEAVNVYSNVKNGYGIFTAHTFSNHILQ
jgi:hypothetical protein